MKTQGDESREIVTDKLRRYVVAHQEPIPDLVHDTSQYSNNRAELSRQPTRIRERGMRRFKTIVHLNESESHFSNEKQGLFDHVAFQTSNLVKFIQILKDRKIDHSIVFLTEI